MANRQTFSEFLKKIQKKKTAQNDEGREVKSEEETKDK